MAVTIHVNGTSNSLVHKGSNGIAKCTVPDVCKTPSPGGPVPIPYPVIISMSSDLKKGTKTVKVDGKKMAAIKGSEFSRCTGDEPGTAGGVKSSTNMKEAKWILYSFDVKLDGKNACRLSDKMTMNHGNTVCLCGEMQVPVVPSSAEHDIKCAIQKCDKKDVNITKTKKGKPMPKDSRCGALGTAKHKCVQETLEKKNAACQCEQPFDMTRDPPMPCAKSPGKGLGRRPDVVVGGPPPASYDVYDANFPCPDSVKDTSQFNQLQQPSPIPSAGTPGEKTPKAMRKNSKENKDYKRIANGGKSKVLTPKNCEGEQCDD